MVFSSSSPNDLPASLRPGQARPQRLVAVHRAFASGGVQAGLHALNQGVAHRYSGIFRLDGLWLENTYLVDKLGQIRPEGLERVLLKDSLCQFALREGYLRSDNTWGDERLDFSPYQNMTMSYHGVPIVSPHGLLYGTLCHFDFVEQTLSDDEFSCMHEVAKLIPMFVL